MTEKKIKLIRAARHGAYVTATGDLTRLRTLRKKAAKSNYIQDAWAEVGKMMIESTTTISKNSRRSSRTPGRA